MDNMTKAEILQLIAKAMLDEAQRIINDPLADGTMPTPLLESHDIQKDAEKQMDLPFQQEITQHKKPRTFAHKIQVKYSWMKVARTYASAREACRNIDGKDIPINHTHGRCETPQGIVASLKKYIQKRIDDARPNEKIEKLTRWDKDGNEISA